MPGSLPPASGYTYAVELSGDEAIAAGAKQIRFSQPVYVYVDNFIGFPVGETVPSGYYDRAAGQWIASQNGRVINILSISGGIANIDTNGDGAADDAATLAALGITTAEQQQLAVMYPQTPKQLWRVPVNHFSSWDFNWPDGPPPDAQAPKQPLPVLTPTKKPCEIGGSIIECQNQVLGERLNIPGTPFTLNYRSSRVPGHTDASTVNIAISDDNIPTSVKRIDLVIQVAGRQFLQSFPRAANQNYAFTWDGKDAYGRAVQGRQTLNVQIGYVYQLVYLTARPSSGDESAFGHYTYYGSPVSASQVDREIIIWQKEQLYIGAFNDLSQGLGGWDLDIHHVYDPVGKVLSMGDGSWRSADSLGATIVTTVAGNGSIGTGVYSGDGGQAINAPLDEPCGLAVGPDGSFYFANSWYGRINRVGVDGIISTVAGGGYGIAGYGGGDGGAATSAFLYEPSGGVAFGPDGSLYINDSGNGRIRKVGLDGIITTVAGGGPYANGVVGDGSPATTVMLSEPYGIAIGPDGSIYFNDGYHHTVRRVGPDGIISTVAGNGRRGFSGDGGPAISASLNYPTSVAVGPDGSIYIGDSYNNRIRRVGPNGIITTFAGNGSSITSGDGGLATNASFNGPYTSLAVGPDGSVYFSGTQSDVRRIGPNGIITTVAGNGTSGFSGDGGLALNASFIQISGVTVGPDGDIYISDVNSSRIRRLSFYWPGVSVSDSIITSEDGRQIFIFDETGKHQRTLNAMTGAALFTFGYDAKGKLATVTDGSGNITTITRDSNGNPTSIVAPFGQTTSLTIDANGYLASFTDPAGNSTAMKYSDSGLMSTFIDPKGNIHNFDYDSNGLLVRDTNPAGGFTALTGANTQNTKQTTVTSALGRVSTYFTEYLTTGNQRQTITNPIGGQSIMLSKTDGSEQITMSDGTTSLTTLGTDPRFGSMVYFPSSTTVTTPSGLSQVVSSVRITTLLDSANPLSLATQTDTTSVNGRIYTTSYDTTLKQSTTTTPVGRKLVVLTDSLGRPLSLTLDPSVTPLTFSYDPKGRLIQATQGSQQLTYGYDSLGRVAIQSDSLNNTSTFGYDNADRLTLLTLPSGRKYGFAYDANGNRTQITMPNGAVHTLGYTVINLGNSYTPPNNLPYSWNYSLDQEWVKTVLPGGRSVNAGYDNGGRPLGIVYPEATVTLNYGDLTSRASRIIRVPAGIGLSQQITLTYDGSLVTGRTYFGASNGQFSYTYDNNFFLSQIKLTSGSDTVTNPITRDSDGLVIGYGPFTYAHSGPAGALSAVSGPALNSTVSYDNMGRLSQRIYKVNGISIYSIQLGYDSRGNISSKTETVSGTTTTLNYSYDADGQLINAAINGVDVEHYTYDVNGNRTGYKRPGSNELSGFDSQDRIVQVGGTVYQFNADGQLTQRGTDTFQYSAQGELLKATVAGQVITYSYDGGHRLTARTDGSGTTQYLYSSIKNPFQLTAMRDPVGVLTYYYYDDSNKLFAFDKGTTRYYVATDQLGTPKVISDAAGTVVKIMEHDSFGWATFDSNPDFSIPVGFAGGISDSKTRLVRFGYRDYEPETGRWAAKDPIFFGGGQGNLYQYVQGNPVRFIDPFGLWYVDFNFTGGLGTGFTGGLQIGPTGAYLYGGLGYGEGGGASLTLKTGDPCTGFSSTITTSGGTGIIGGNASQALDKTGVSKTGDTTYGSAGIGWGIGAGYAVTGTYTLRIW